MPAEPARFELATREVPGQDIVRLVEDCLVHAGVSPTISRDVAPCRLRVHERHVDELDFEGSHRSGIRTEVEGPRRFAILTFVREAHLDSDGTIFLRDQSRSRDEGIFHASA